MANIRSVSSQFVFGLTVWLTFKGERKKGETYGYREREIDTIYVWMTLEVSAVAWKMA